MAEFLEVDPAVTLWGLLLEVESELKRRLDGVITSATGLSGKQFEVLLRVAQTRGQQLRLTQLATMTSFTSGGTSKLIVRMESAGLLARAHDPNDGRATLVTITDQGWDLLHRGLAAHVPSLYREMVDVLTTEQTEQLESVLRALRTAFTDLGGTRRSTQGSHVD
ncbi:winged helix DNA-binding protein [Nocardia tengchongensis]|uniref:Winged helix DNA-binding protein n=1 Tax=Nocardia tengchongensis TaxID=2055889 RepID=A0ABX8CN20_9NOCA|nr:MarR family transcriptional regulator [Nocardia tengchongensis]QVI20746.1 winged helix DNA-binding protein [Nocardia tengchongensis]